MANAQQVPAPHAVEDPQAWLAGVLRTRFAEVTSYRTTALDRANDHAVHEMRVAVRRLRSVIRDFAEIADTSPLSESRSELKKLADALGAVRDADVKINALEKLRPKSKHRLRDGIDKMIGRATAERERGFVELAPHLSPDELDGLERRFETALDNSIDNRDLFIRKDMETAIGEIISNRIDDFSELTDCFHDAFSRRRIHKLRIAGKHLRYAVELFSLHPERGANEYAEEIALMQAELGKLHDCDVWIAELENDLDRQDQESITGSEHSAALWLLSRLVSRRAKAYRNALRLWARWEREHFLDRLREWKPLHPGVETVRPPLRLVRK